MTNEQNVVGNESVGIQEVAQPFQQSSVNSDSEVAQVSEKMLPQSKVNEIVGATKKSAYDKAYSDAKSEFEAKSADYIRDSVKKEIETFATQAYESEQKKEQELQDTRTIESLKSKVDVGSKKYEDFNEITAKFPYGEFPGLLKASDKVDNSADVLYHIAKNRLQYRAIADDLNRPANHPLHIAALDDIKQLSVSLKNSETVKQKNLPRAPLSQIQPSNVGVDSGKKSISELRKKYTV